MVEVGELKIEHVLLFVIVAFVIYHFMGRCRCGNGFSVSGGNEPFLHKVNRYVMGTFGLRGSWH